MFHNAVRIEVEGRLTQDPKLGSFVDPNTLNQRVFCELRVATNGYNRQSKEEGTATFYTFTYWSGAAGLSKLARKGDAVTCIGKDLRARTYTSKQTGEVMISLDVRGTDFELEDRPGGWNAQAQAQAPAAGQAQVPVAAANLSSDEFPDMAVQVPVPAAPLTPAAAPIVVPAEVPAPAQAQVLKGTVDTSSMGADFAKLRRNAQSRRQATVASEKMPEEPASVKAEQDNIDALALI